MWVTLDKAMEDGWRACDAASWLRIGSRSNPYEPSVLASPRRFIALDQLAIRYKAKHRLRIPQAD
jgi:hypothetical protein